MLSLFIISLFSFLFGWFIYRRPLKAFEIQKEFYRRINWNIEPVSVPKEIRNTRWMGIFLMAFVVGVWAYLWLQ